MAESSAATAQPAPEAGSPLELEQVVAGLRAARQRWRVRICSVIGGNVWLPHSVPPGSHVTQADTQSRPSTP